MPTTPIVLLGYFWKLLEEAYNTEVLFPMDSQECQNNALLKEIPKDNVVDND